MDNTFDARAMIRKGTVQSVDDTGPVQMVTVKTGDGALYTAEVHQLFGHASVPPADGATAILFCIGGDPANQVALLTNPSARFGNQAGGESTLYAGDASRVAVRSGGTIEIIGGNQVTISAPDVTINATGAVTIAAAGGITLTGDLSVTGNITATGTISP